MARAVILADDFTGALDTGVKFSQGIPAPCAVVDVGQPFDWNMTEVVAVDTESRNLPEQEAYERIVCQTEYAIRNKIPVLYKKTDSVLRGNIGTELEAMIMASGRKSVVFAPAFPAMERTVEKGCLWVGGKPLTETSYSKDYICPIGHNRIADIIKKQTHIPVIETEPSRLPNWRTDAPAIFVCDAKEEEDLEAVAKAVQPVADQVILAGCAGFASHIAEYVLRAGDKEREPGDRKVSGEWKQQNEWMNTEGRTVICGSMNERTRQQIRYARKRGVYCYKLHPGYYIGEDTPGKAEDKLSALQKEHPNLLLYTVSEDEDILSAIKYAEDKGIPTALLYRKIAEGLGKIAASCVKNARRRGYCFIGGDTLYHALKEMRYKSISPLLELGQGIILSHVQTQESRKLIILSKAGSFGKESAIWDMFRF